VPQASTLFDFDRSRLALNYDVNLLQKETLSAINHLPPVYIHYSVVPLTTREKIDNTVTDFSNPEWTSWADTALLKKCPYILEILGSLKCQKTNIRLLRLEAGGELKEHTDPQLNLQHLNQVRLHVPIFTSELVQFTLNGTNVPLQPGELWYMRLSDPHSVRNYGQTERIQLSIDVVVNDWVKDLILQGEKS